MRFRLLTALVVAGAFLGGFTAAVLRPADNARPARADNRDAATGALLSFDWWYGQRAAPGRLIPRGAFEKAARSAAVLAGTGRLAGTNAAPTSWKSLGPFNIAGRVLAIAVDPSAPNVVWAGAASGGLWKTTTGGQGLAAWSYVSTGLPVVSVSAIAIDPLAPSVMYLGTGEISLYQRGLVGVVGARSSYGMGIVKSTDAGATWVQTPLTFTFPQITAVQRIVINPVNPATLFAATSEGVYKSTDAGASWNLSNSVLMAMDLVMNPADTTMLWSAHGNSNSSPNPGIYRTTDAGSTWSLLAGGLPTVNFGRTALGVSPAAPSVVYAGVTDAATFQTTGLYKSTDAGLTWSLVSTQPYAGTQGWYNNVIAVSPLTADTLLCNGLTIYRSTNGGTNLAAASDGLVHVDHHAAAYDPSNPHTVYFGTDGGVWKSNDDGVTFINCNNDLCTTQFYPGLAVYPYDTVTSLGGLQDNGTLLYSGTTSWTQVFFADGGWCAIDPTDRDVMYAEAQFGALVKSTDGGNHFASIGGGLPPLTTDWNFLAPFVLSPSSTNILYAGSRNVYKTTNGGASWFASNGMSTLNGTNISCLAVARGNADTVLAGTGDGRVGVTPTFGVFRTINGGSVWTNVGAGLPNRYPTDVEFDPTNSGIAYLAYSGYGTPHLFRSETGGATWIDATSNLPDIPVQAVTVDPANPSHVYAGTDLGVWHSSDRGGSWEPWSDGMPPAMVLDLVVSPVNGSLRAATFGNGVYERPLVRTHTVAIVSPAGGDILSSRAVAQVRWSSRFVGSLRLEFSSDDGATWDTVAAGIPAAPQSYGWSVPDIATSQGRIRLTDEADADAVDSSTSPFTLLLNPDLESGWNLLSVPRSPADPRPSSLFPAATSKAFAYAHSYVVAESLRNGIGYWLKFQWPQYSAVPGDSILADTVDVKSGWNLLGSLSLPVPRAAVTTIPPGITASSYFSYLGGYHIADTIAPGRGYWIKVNADGRIILAPPGPGAAPSTLPAAAVAAERVWNTLTIADARGGSQTLRFSSSSAAAAGGLFELPPLPPGGIFDVRFAAGTMAAQVGVGGSAEILITGAAPPVALAWEIVDGSSWSLAGKGEDIPAIQGSGKGTLAGAGGLLRLAASGAGGAARPAAFALHQNYPNPFNPSTRISYALPHAAAVELAVYGVTGARVATLVNGVVGEGEHEAVWDARGAASGVYFCRLTADGATVAVRKMLLLR